ncbi:hypothetical protein BDR07DRAFT_1407039 [Suillus spraguei]|nr:hypothetical protein BDR07DRAFT_1407039 [Suillus spraguei]
MVPSLLLFFPITRIFLPMLRSLYSTVPASLLLFFSQPPSLLLFHSHTRRHWFSLQHRHCSSLRHCCVSPPTTCSRPCSQKETVPALNENAFLNHTKWPKYTISSIPSLFLTLVPSCFCRSSCRFCGS